MKQHYQTLEILPTASQAFEKLPVLLYDQFIHPMYSSLLKITTEKLNQINSESMYIFDYQDFPEKNGSNRHYFR